MLSSQVLRFAPVLKDLRQHRPSLEKSGMNTASVLYPVGTPGVPWGHEERAE